jgi:hypothetical protein
LRVIKYVPQKQEKTLFFRFIIAVGLVLLALLALNIDNEKSALAKKEYVPAKRPTVPAKQVRTVEDAVRTYFRTTPVLVEIARCESQFRHTLKNGSVLRGRINPQDIGVMQINLQYHKEVLDKKRLNPFVLEDNLAYARHLYEKHGTAPWNSSRPCWGNKQNA